MSEEKILVAVITGGHPYDVAHFNALLKSMPAIEFEVQSVEEFCTNAGGYTDRYDGVLFYNMTLATPQDEPAWNKADKKAIQAIAARGQGMLVLHHAVLAFPDWDVWAAITGLDGASNEYYFDQNVHLHIEDPQHIITEGIDDWEMIDETYCLTGASAGSQILITTNHEKSMNTIAWTREYQNSRVFCLQSGHDWQAFSNPDFRRVLHRGLQWVCQRI